MAINNKTYQPLQAISIKAAADLPPFRFVALNGALCADSARAFGVTEVSWVTDELAAVVVLGTIPVEAASAVNAGDDVTSAADGKAKTAEAGDAVNGRALTSALTGEFVKIKLVP